MLVKPLFFVKEDQRLDPVGPQTMCPDSSLVDPRYCTTQAYTHQHADTQDLGIWNSGASPQTWYL